MRSSILADLLILERVARRLVTPLLVECGPDDEPSQRPALQALKVLSSCEFHRMGAEPASEEQNTSSFAADLAVSLVDNAQETFGLAVAKP